MPLASFGGTVVFTGPCVFTGPVLLEQIRADALTAPISFDVFLTLDRSLWDAISARVRWTGSVLEFGRDALPPPSPVDPLLTPTPPPEMDVIVLGRQGTIAFDEALPPPQQAPQQTTLKFNPAGEIWAIPSEDFIPPDPSTCPTAVPGPARRVSPRSFGNKPTRVTLLLGKSPAAMQAIRLFQGQSFQKSNKGDVAVTGDITCVDDSCLYANIPLCYELLPFSGLHRGEIVKQIAAIMGIAADDVIVPDGREVRQPLLLSNQSLLTFLNQFGAAENWVASFDEFGRLFVREIDLKRAPISPDWILDAALGDFDYDSIEEIPPSAPPTRVVAQIAQPVSGTGPGASDLTITTREIVEEQTLYNPECVRVPPSGLVPYLLGDGSYHTLPAQVMMLTSRIITEVTTVNGQETKRVVTTFGFYNPLAFDPNFNTYLPTNVYDLAYWTKNAAGTHVGSSFHRDESERFVEISEDALETIRDIYGTILKTIETVKGWYAPHRAEVFVGGSRSQIINDSGAAPPAYVYAGNPGTMRTIPAEVYGVTGQIEKTYLYGSDGTLASIDEIRMGFFSPPSRCDFVQTSTTPDTGPPVVGTDPSTPPPDNPPPITNPPPVAWHPLLTGPTAQSGPVFTFKISVAGGPTGPATPTSIQGSSADGIPAFGSVGGTPRGHAGPPSNPLDASSAPEALVTLDMSGTNSGGLANPDATGRPFYVVMSVFIGSVQYWSNTIIFDPWTAGVPF